MKKVMNQSVLNLNAYHLTPDQQKIKLNQNEFPVDWPVDVKQKLIEFIQGRQLNRYPDFIPDNLKGAIAEYAGVKKENVIAGNGSNEMLLCLMLALASTQRSIVICEPTFTVYNMLAGGMGCPIHKTSLNEDLTYNLESLKKASQQCNQEGVMILCSPNNPTGGALSKEEIVELLEYHKGFIILDQAYIEFGGYNAVPLINEYPNLIITRTFSKALAGAGLRLGYMLGHEDIICHINKIKLPYNINCFTEFAGELLLSQKESLQKRVEEVIIEGKRLFSALKELPFEIVYPSEANFFIVKTDVKDALFAYLKDHDILIRDVSSYPMLDNCLRISVGAVEENNALLESIKDFFEER